MSPFEGLLGFAERLAEIGLVCAGVDFAFAGVKRLESALSFVGCFAGALLVTAACRNREGRCRGEMGWKGSKKI